MRTGEVFEYGQAFAEVGFNRRFDNFTTRLGHQTAHPGQLADLFLTASSTRVSHQVPRVDIGTVITIVVFERIHHRDLDLIAGVRPCVQHLLVSFLRSNHAFFVQLLLLQHDAFGTGDHFFFVIRSLQITRGE